MHDFYFFSKKAVQEFFSVFALCTTTRVNSPFFFARADWLLNPARDSICYLPQSEVAVVLCRFFGVWLFTCMAYTIIYLSLVSVKSDG